MRGPGHRAARNASDFGKRRSNFGRPMPTINSRPNARFQWLCWTLSGPPGKGLTGLGRAIVPRRAPDTLEELASKGVNEFALIMQPLKLKGATGSTVAP